MGRGLSDLQKRILVMAYKRRVTYGEHKVDLFTPEALYVLYFADVADPPRRIWNKNLADKKHFDVRRIGEARYSAAKASVSRVFKRLEERGLAYRVLGLVKWSGIVLTPEGIEQAQMLSVNEWPPGC